MGVESLPLKPLTDKEFEKFLGQCEAMESINFAEIANRMNLDWFRQVKPAIVANPAYFERTQELLETFKYKLAQMSFNIAVNGKRRGQSPDMSFIKLVIELIDKGLLIEKKAEAEEPQDEISINEELKRMGILDND